jgi:hypothetical protein
VTVTDALHTPPLVSMIVAVLHCVTVTLRSADNEMSSIRLNSRIEAKFPYTEAYPVQIEYMKHLVKALESVTFSLL